MGAARGLSSSLGGQRTNKVGSFQLRHRKTNIYRSRSLTSFYLGDPDELFAGLFTYDGGAAPSMFEGQSGYWQDASIPAGLLDGLLEWR